MRPFVRAFKPRVTERRDREADRRQFHTESQKVRQPYDVRTIMCKAAERRSCKIYKTVTKRYRRTVPALQPCGHCAFLAAALR